MWPEAREPDGSFYFDNQPNMLDQFLANKNMATAASPVKGNPASARMLKLDGTVHAGVYKKPNPVRRHGRPDK
jgi:hypothetical protein